MKTIIVDSSELPLIIIVDEPSSAYYKFTGILADVYLETEVGPSEIVSKSRKQVICDARNLFIKKSLAANFSRREIAEFLNCDYTAIVHHENNYKPRRIT